MRGAPRVQVGGAPLWRPAAPRCAPRQPRARVQAVAVAAAERPQQPAEAAAAAAQAAEAAPAAAPQAAATLAADELVVTTFRWPAALGGSEVGVTGTFNGWGAPLELRRAAPGADWVRTVALPPGAVQFKFVVDGAWVASPCDQSVLRDTCNNQRWAAGG